MSQVWDWRLSEVAHLPEYSEETFDYDPSNAPETPFTPDTPFTPGDTPFTPGDDLMDVEEPQTPAVAMTPMQGKRRKAPDQPNPV